MVAEILDLSREMQRCAECEDWTRVQEILTHRDALTRSAEPAELARCLESLLAETREVLELARAAKSRIAGQLRQLDEGRKAVRAYGETGPQNSREEIAVRVREEAVTPRP